MICRKKESTNDLKKKGKKNHNITDETKEKLNQERKKIIFFKSIEKSKKE